MPLGHQPIFRLLSAQSSDKPIGHLFTMIDGKGVANVGYWDLHGLGALEKSVANRLSITLPVAQDATPLMYTQTVFVDDPSVGAMLQTMGSTGTTLALIDPTADSSPLGAVKDKLTGSLDALLSACRLAFKMFGTEEWAKIVREATLTPLFTEISKIRNLALAESNEEVLKTLDCWNGVMVDCKKFL